MEVYTDEGNFQTLKVLIATGINDQSIHTNIVSATETVVPYLCRGRLPILKTVQGTHIFSANSAASLVFVSAGRSSDAVKTDQWLEWESALLLPQVHRVALASGGKLESSLLSPLRELLQTLHTSVENGFVLDKLTIADIVIWSTVFPLFHTSDQLKAVVLEFPGVVKWFESLSKQPAFERAVASLFPKEIKKCLKTSLSAAPVPPAVGASTSRLLGDESNGACSNQPAAEEDTGAAVTAAEREAAVKAWQSGRQSLPTPIDLSHPILPKEGVKNVLITSALPYVNNVPHLGNIIGCVLSADVFSRFCKMRNYNTLYICGTDEYGTATETKAMAEGLTPMQICEKYNRLHTEIYEWFNIGFDHFGRTTTDEQTKIAQDIFWKLHENGFVLKDVVQQLHCQNCNRFLADRFVEGTCPFCAYEDARGDQCDKCGKLINAPELRNPRCKTCNQTPVIKSTSHLFLDLPQIAPQLETFLNREFEQGIWTSNTKVITKSWLRDGLKPRCISRDLKWGTPVPLEGYTEKVFYVWYDAPIGYISITAKYTDQWEQWWKNPEQVSLYQFMAKDNIPFHSVIFPCSLLGTGQKWTMVNHLSATEYLNYEDTKFSKSRGVGVFGNDAKGTGIPADIWRFYLLYLRPESQDSSFSWDDFALKNNSELLNNLGNFIQRALVFVNNGFAQHIPKIDITEKEEELLVLVTREISSYIDNLEKIRLRDGIRNILNISRLGNQYIQANKPWVLIKGNQEERARAGTIVGLAANMAYLLSLLIKPYMPEVSVTIRQQLNAPEQCDVITDKFVCFLPEGHCVGKPSPLFRKIEAEEIAELRKTFAGNSQTEAKTAEKAPTMSAGPGIIGALTTAVTNQGNVVRELKAANADKSIINTEVSKLLELKAQLSQLSGVVAAADKPKDKSSNGILKEICEEMPAFIQPINNAQLSAKNAQGAAAAGNAPLPQGSAISPESPEMVALLQEQVSKQGEVVRNLKAAAKVEKTDVDREVAKLLDLKRILAVAMGKDPNDVAAGGSKKRKGKKK